MPQMAERKVRMAFILQRDNAVLHDETEDLELVLSL